MLCKWPKTKSTGVFLVRLDTGRPRHSEARAAPVSRNATSRRLVKFITATTRLYPSERVETASGASRRKSECGCHSYAPRSMEPSSRASRSVVVTTLKTNISRVARRRRRYACKLRAANGRGPRPRNTRVYCVVCEVVS